MRKTGFPATLLRYLFWELTFAIVAVTTIIVTIFLCNQFIRLLGFAVSGRYPSSLLLHLLFLQVPLLLGHLLPLGLFIALLLCIGRWYVDSEMVVMMACGVSQKQLLTMALSYAMIVVLIVTGIVCGLGPSIAEKRDKILNAAESSSVFQTLLPGHFQSSKDNSRVFYVEDMTHDRQTAYNIFVAQKETTTNQKQDQKKWTILSSQKAYQMIDAQTKNHYLVTHNGYRYMGIPGEKDYQITQFNNYGFQIDAPPTLASNTGTEIIPTLALFKGALHQPTYMAELQWRLSMPLSVIILTLLALPLCRVNPRQGRFMQLLPAVLLYAVYANLMLVSRLWVEDGHLPLWLGLWWIHVIMLGMAGALLWRLFRQPAYRS